MLHKEILNTKPDSMPIEKWENIISEIPFELIINDKWNPYIFELTGDNPEYFYKLKLYRMFSITKAGVIALKLENKEPKELTYFFKKSMKGLEERVKILKNNI